MAEEKQNETGKSDRLGNCEGRLPKFAKEGHSEYVWRHHQSPGRTSLVKRCQRSRWSDY